MSLITTPLCDLLVHHGNHIDGVEDEEFIGVGARFGKPIVSNEKNANQTHLALASPRGCCSPLNKKVVSVFLLYYCKYMGFFRILLSWTIISHMTIIHFNVFILLVCWRCSNGGSG